MSPNYTKSWPVVSHLRAPFVSLYPVAYRGRALSMSGSSENEVASWSPEEGRIFGKVKSTLSLVVKITLRMLLNSSWLDSSSGGIVVLLRNDRVVELIMPAIVVGLRKTGSNQNVSDVERMCST